MTDHRARSRQALIEKFQVIAQERLERLNNAMMQLEQNPDSEDAASLAMREIHTLKGEAKLMGFADVNLVAHKIEDLLIRARDENFRVPARLFDFILKGFDAVGYLMHKQAGSEPSVVDLGSFVEQVEHLLQETWPRAAAAEEARTTAAVGAAAGAVEAASGAEVAAAAQAEQVEQAEKVEEAELSLPLVTTIRDELSLRVDVRKLDDLTYLVGDLLRHQLQTEHALLVFQQIGEQWRQDLQQMQTLLAGHDLTVDASRHQLEELAQHTRRWLSSSRALQDNLVKIVGNTRDESAEGGDLLAELESTVKDLRLLPLSSIFGRYPRAVRDLAKEQGKQVRLVARGGELQVDKQVLEKIGEPLLHLIRNAIDHGVEPPGERLAAGKPGEGKIEITARQAGAHVEIRVSDDGQGLSPDAIREAAVTRGLMRGAEVEGMQLEDLLNLIFQPGLSTRARATDVSGRGIGLDVVKDGIENLGGSVRVQSERGFGTTFVLDVPIFVALMRGLVVEAGQGTYAIPSFAVHGVTSTGEERLEPAGAGVALRLDDGLIPLQDLGLLVGLAEEAAPVGPHDRVVVIQSQGRRLGLRVKRVVGERELVQRPLDPFVKAVPLLIGTAVHEHAKLAFVLNVSEIMQSSLTGHERGHGHVLAGAPVGERRVLLVEDSELTRDMLEGVLRGLGHRVIEAANGRDALDRLQSLRPDLVVTDLEMPVMDGFELIGQIRASETFGEVPIVVLTTRGSEADKQRAAELGADAYLVKAEFSEEGFAATVTRYLLGSTRSPGGRD